MNTSNFLTIPASMFPDQETIVFEGQRFTYAQVTERVNRLAHALQGLGIQKGDKVAVLQTNSHQYVEAYYAAMKLGAVFVPLNYRAKTDELRYMLSTAEARALLVGDRYLDLADSLRPELPLVKHYIAMESPREGVLNFEGLVASASGEEIDTEVEDEDLSILMFTSGTTALPKGVLLTHNDFVTYIFGTTEPPDGMDRGATLLAVPIYHIAGTSAIMTSIFGGRRLVILRQFEAPLWLETIQKERITHAFLVPTMLKRVLDEPDFSQYDLSGLQILSYGAAPMPLPVIKRAIEVFPKTVGFINAFGQTETTSTVTMLWPEDHRLEGTPEEMEQKLRRLASVGRPLPDVELKIVDEEGRELPPGQVGEIAIRTARAMKGYADEGQTRQALVGGWLYTRDMGWVDEAGYVFLAGRKSDMIIRGGENIAPEEVEAVLHTHPAVEEAAVVGLPDEEWGEKVMAVVVLKEAQTATAEEIIEFCRQRLASFKKPEVVRFVDALPRNPLGKVMRKELREQFAWPR